MATRALVRKRPRSRKPTAAKRKPAKLQGRTVLFKSVPVHERTYARLSLYRVGGMSFDDVLTRLMENQSQESFHKEYVAWQRRVLANMDGSGDFETI